MKFAHEDYILEVRERGVEVAPVEVPVEAVETPTEGEVVAHKEDLPAKEIGEAAEVSAVSEVPAEAGAVSAVSEAIPEAEASEVPDPREKGLLATAEEANTVGVAPDAFEAPTVEGASFGIREAAAERRAQGGAEASMSDVEIVRTQRPRMQLNTTAKPVPKSTPATARKGPVIEGRGIGGTPIA